jgi:hypothetical protein
MAASRREMSFIVPNFAENTWAYNFLDKNRLLHCTATAEASQTSMTIPKPKGSVGAAGFSLITAMKLDKYDWKDKSLYNDILVCCESA